MCNNLIVYLCNQPSPFGGGIKGEGFLGRGLRGGAFIVYLCNHPLPFGEGIKGKGV